MSEERQRSVASQVALWFGLLLVLLVLYLGSTGPFVWLASRGKLSNETADAIATIYAPIEWAMKNCEPFHDVMEGYVRLWE